MEGHMEEHREEKSSPTPEPSMASFQQDQQSGFVQLAQGHDAFAARMMLVENAVSTLDIQYYIWEYNLTGRLLFEALVRAAERGVAVRLLLDDNNTARLVQADRNSVVYGNG